MRKGKKVIEVESPSRRPIPVELPAKPEEGPIERPIEVPNWPIRQPVEVPATTR